MFYLFLFQESTSRRNVAVIQPHKTSARAFPSSPIICTLCETRLSSLQRLRTHGASAHNIPAGSVAMNMLVQGAQRLACPFWRVCTASRLSRLLGQFASSAHFTLKVKEVLKFHNILVEGEFPSNSISSEPSAPPLPPHLSRAPAATYVQSTPPEVTTPAVSIRNSDVPNRSAVAPKKEVGRGSRGQVSKSLQKTVLTKNFCSVELCKLSKLYQNACSNLKDGRKLSSVVRTAQYLHRYISFCRMLLPGGENISEWHLVTSTGVVDEYISCLTGVFRPFTIKNHGQEVVRFLRDAGTMGEVSRDMPHGLRAARLQALTKWEDCLTKLLRTGRSFQRNRILQGQFQPCSFRAIFDYLQDESTVRRMIASLSRLEEHFEGDCNRSREVPSNFTEDWLRITRFLVCTVLCQGMRLCVVQNLKLAEYDSAKQHCSTYVIRVAEHKTQAIYGAACFVLSGLKKDLWDRYRCLRAKVLVKEDALDSYFLNSSGSKISSSMLEDLNVYLRSRGHEPVTHTLVRKSIETLNQLYASDLGRSKFSGSNAVCSAVQTYLCHSAPVVGKHYVFRTDQTVVNEADLVNRVVLQSILESVILDRAHQLLPNDCFGNEFPTKEKLLSLLQEVCPELGLQVQELCDYVYRQVQIRWSQSFLDALVSRLKIKVGRECLNGEDQRQTAKTVVSDLPSVWNPHKGDIVMRILNCMRL